MSRALMLTGLNHTTSHTLWKLPSFIMVKARNRAITLYSYISPKA